MVIYKFKSYLILSFVIALALRGVRMVSDEKIFVQMESSGLCQERYEFDDGYWIKMRLRA